MFRRVLVLGAVLSAMFVPDAVFACATCMAGDPTITTMGTEKPFAGRMRFGVDYVKRGETVGPSDAELETDEERVTLNFSYALSTEWMFAASLPFVTKEVKRYDLTSEKGSGVGDMDVTARWFGGGDSSIHRRTMWGMQFGLRLPTSSEEKSNGEAVDIDAQPGVGATIPSLGLWYGIYDMPWFFYVSTTYQHAITEGYQGYQAGDVLLLTGMIQWAPAQSLALQFSLDSRFKKQDEYDGVKDEDSGGVLVMGTPGVAWTPIEDLVFSLSYQIPFIENAHGHQEEDPLLRVGVAYDF